jgi:DegV family protein with EDD domain
MKGAMSVRVITDSTATLPAELCAQWKIAVVSLCISIGGQSVREQELDLTELYRRLDSGETATSSQPSQTEFEDTLERLVVDGDEVLGVFISADLSGTFSAACLARERVLARHPQAHIEILDSRSSAMQQGLAVLAAARSAHEPQATLARAAAAARFVIGHSRILFAPATLEYLKAGGRFESAAALIGQVLHIRPVFTVSEGRAAPFKVVRTQANAVRSMVETFVTEVKQRGLADVVVQHILAEPLAAELAATVQGFTGRLPMICPISPVIGLHIGPGAIGLAWATKA